MIKNNIKYVRTLWGVDINLKDLKSVDNFLKKSKKQGFSVLEVATGFFPEEEISNFSKASIENGFRIIPQLHTCGYPVSSYSVKDHLDDFKTKFEKCLVWNPVIINTHSGRDDWTLEDNLNFYNEAQNFEKSARIKCLHETHRVRSLYNPFISLQILRECKSINLTFDYSNWVVVNSRFLSPSTEPYYYDLMAIVERRTKLIHARVSTTDQIQTINPLSPDNSEYKKEYYRVWKNIVDKSDETFINPEYGPAPFEIVTPNRENSLDKIVDLALEDLKTSFNNY